MTPEASAPPVSWKTVAVPVEHGGWGFLVEPLVLGLVLVPSVAGICLAAAAVAAFLVRHPLRLALIDRRKGVRYPRTGLAERVVIAYAALALAFALVAVPLSRSPFWPPVVLAAPAALVALWSDARGRSREALPEAAGAVALGGSVTAIALAGGLPAGPAFGAWALLALRGVTAVLYVRARLRLDRGLPSGTATALGSHVAGVAAAGALAAAGWGPWLGLLALLLLLLRAWHGLSSRRPRLRPQALGFREMGWGLVTLALLAVGYRLRL
ncbi:MAG: YwiC-like family protein [Acidobacteria bacterium]|nr:YwiC-like family protein [Acidobacteriota bacterium]